MKTPQRKAPVGAVRPEIRTGEAGLSAGSLAFMYDCTAYITAKRKDLTREQIRCLRAAIKLIMARKLSIVGDATPEEYLGLRS